MTDEIDDLKAMWNAAKAQKADSETRTDDIVVSARKEMKQVRDLQMKGIIVLLITLLGISAFFAYVANFNDVISHVGSGLMIGVLVIRILIELASMRMAAKIDFSESAINNNESTLRYYYFRKNITGTVTVSLLIIYTIGFYLLTPEFSTYFSMSSLILIDASYLLAAVIFTWFIRTATKKEMLILRELSRIRKDLLILPE